MSRYLRTVSTRRLLAIIVGFSTAVAAGAAIAVAAASGGPVPPKKPLANAIRGALGAREVAGITARVTFTNHLIDSSNIQGSDPILTGATGRLWLSPSTHQLRLELQSERGDAQVVVNNGAFWVYDPSGNTVYKGTLPKDAFKGHKAAAGTPDKIPSVAQIQSDLNRAARHIDLSGAIPSDVAGHAAYTIRVSPKRADRTDEALEIVCGLWSGRPFSFSGRYYSVAETVFVPTPVQQPRIPIWVAGRWPARRPFRRAARFDGVFPIFEGIGHTDRPSPARLGEVVSFVASEREARRVEEPFDVIVEAQSDGPAADLVASYEEVGLTWWIEKLGWFRGSVDEVRARIEAGPPVWA